MQEIAVGGVHLQRIEAKPLGALCGHDERVAHTRKTERIERQRRQLAFLVRHRGWTFGLPAAFGERDLLPAVPRHMARSLAAGMRELHRYRSPGMLADRGDDRLQRRLGGIVPQAEAAWRDTADGLHMRGLDAEHRSPR